MKRYLFYAYNLSSEIDLNKIAVHFGISRKFRWEDSLKLTYAQLKHIINETKYKYVRIYSYGSIVFTNFNEGDIVVFTEYLNSNFNIKYSFLNKYDDNYELKVAQDSKLESFNDYASCDNDSIGPVAEIISLILARSVALDKMENSISKLTDELEEEIILLEKGKLNIKDEDLAKLASKILNFKYSSISNIMLFDKPDITWDDIDINKFYYEIVELFELKERYEQIKHKSEILMDITEVFSTLGHERRSTRLEWAVIILIVIEIIISVTEMIIKGLH